MNRHKVKSSTSPAPTLTTSRLYTRKRIMSYQRNQSSSQKVELVARRLDIGASRIDLLQTVAKIASSSNRVTQMALRVIYQLSKERINQEDLDYYPAYAKDLTRPDMDTLLSSDRMLEGFEKMPRTTPRHLKYISLDRFLMLDPQLS